MRRRKYQSGMTLIELIVAFTILSMLAAMAVPLARHKVRRDKERELRQALHELRIGIDKYKDACDAGKLGQVKVGTECYPETIEILDPPLTSGANSTLELTENWRFRITVGTSFPISDTSRRVDGHAL